MGGARKDAGQLWKDGVHESRQGVGAPRFNPGLTFCMVPRDMQRSGLSILNYRFFLTEHILLQAVS